MTTDPDSRKTDLDPTTTDLDSVTMGQDPTTTEKNFLLYQFNDEIAQSTMHCLVVMPVYKVREENERLREENVALREELEELKSVLALHQNCGIIG